MKIGSSLKTNTTKIPVLSMNGVSVIAEKGKDNMICGFTVTTKKKKTYIPVIRQGYTSAWVKVFNLIKSSL